MVATIWPLGEGTDDPDSEETSAKKELKYGENVNMEATKYAIAHFSTFLHVGDISMRRKLDQRFLFFVEFIRAADDILESVESSESYSGDEERL